MLTWGADAPQGFACAYSVASGSEVLCSYSLDALELSGVTARRPTPEECAPVVCAHAVSSLYKV